MGDVHGRAFAAAAFPKLDAGAGVHIHGVLNNRSQSNFIPIRDCPYYVRGLRTIFEGHD